MTKKNEPTTSTTDDPFAHLRTPEGVQVAASAANPAASRAGLITESPVLGLADIKFTVVDGSRATLALGDRVSDPLTQADLFAIRKQLDAVVQQVY